MQHYNQPRKRKAEFIKPPNKLKNKVGSGGLADGVLDRAQKLLENNNVDFEPLADLYLASLTQGIERCKNSKPEDDVENLISALLYPTMQLKANGGMFGYQLVTEISDQVMHFLERISEPNVEALEIVHTFHTTIRAIVQSKIKGSGGKQGSELKTALHDACIRYFDKYGEPET